MRASAALVETVSADRIRDELIKLVEQAPRPSVGFEIMRATGILPLILPELAEGIGVEQNQYHAYDVFGHGMATVDATLPGNLLLRLSALLHDIGKPRTKDGPHFYGHDLVGAEMARLAFERLHFNGDFAERSVRLIRNHMYQADPSVSPAALRRFIKRVGVDNLDLQFDLRAADIIGSGLPKRGPENEVFQAKVHAMLATQPPLSVKDLAVDGSDAIAALVASGRLPKGSRGGPEVGVLLKAILESVLDDPSLDRDGQLAAMEAFAKSEAATKAMFHRKPDGETVSDCQNGRC